MSPDRRSILPDDSILTQLRALEKRVRILERSGSNQIIDNVPNLTWTGTIGNGTLTAKHTFIAGSVVLITLSIAWGSTTSHPAAPQSILTDSTDFFTTHGFPLFLLSALAWDNSAARYYTGHARAGILHNEVSVSDGTISFDPVFGTSAQIATNLIPFTWATDDELIIWGLIRATAGQ